MDRGSQIRFRKAAAGLVKSLIRARAKQQPGFLSSDALGRWGVSDVEIETRSCAQLLSRVRQLHRRFEDEFLASQNSISSPSSAEDADAIDSLVDQIASFIYGHLDEGIRVAAKGEEVSWSELADWENLTQIRDALDDLPEGEAPVEYTQHQGRDGPIAPNVFVFKGERYEVPAGIVFRLIDALWTASDRTMELSELAEPVWGDCEITVKKGMVGSARTRANRFFKDDCLPFKVQVIKGHAVLSRSSAG